MSKDLKSPMCAKCPKKPCYRNPSEKKPKFCPMKVYPEIVQNSIKYYETDEFSRKIHRISTIIEKEGYGFWPRIREVIEICKRLNIKKVGIAFCIGLSEEAKKLHDVFEEWGFDCYSIVCKCGSVDKTLIGVGENEKLKPNTHESMCNPILQAQILNHVGTEINLIVGLCAGHDTIFLRYSKAPVIYLITKDRATGHSPAISLYAWHYFSKRILPEK